MKKIFFILLLLFSVETCFAQGPYFYKGKDYGTESMFNPASLLLNASYDILQLNNHSRDIFNFPYAKSAKNVFSNLGSPFYNISQYGWWKFIRDEIIPGNLDKKDAQWLPNYQLHLIGGGMTYRYLSEWYEAHNIPSPEIFSIVTVAAEHLLNEVVENENKVGVNVDPIADIYVFDIGGIVLFSFDGVSEFFAEDLNMADWSLQPSITFPNYYLQNNGQYFSIKWELPFWKDNYLFYYFGMSGLAGLSTKINEEDCISVGAGIRANSLLKVNEVGKNTINAVWEAGVFYDKNNSLLASVLVSGRDHYTASLNVYPGFLKIGSFSPGFWAVINRDDSMYFGVSANYGFGIGFE